MEKVTVYVFDESNETHKEILCHKGENLRQVLLENGFSPYVKLTSNINCGGNGICATCGVFIEENPEPIHWHDWLAKRFRYPRLSCKVSVDRDLNITIPKKLIWGKRKKG